MIFLFAGEQSGDLLGQSLLASLKKRDPSLTFFGVGGPRMVEEGMTPFLSMNEFQVMGFTDVLKAFFRLYNNFRKVREKILSTHPEMVILIDYAEFNMRLASSLRRKGYKGKIVHYVSPSVWAWRKSRVHTMAKNVDLLLSILPFEKKYYEKTKLQVKYIGHPLVQEIPPHFTPRDNTLALFPGSRLSEIELNLPLQLAAIKPLQGFSIAISVANEKVKKEIERLTKGIDCELVPNHLRYELMKKSAVAIATSGTVTLELALQKTPTVVTYKISLINYLLGRYIFRIKLPFYCLANIITNAPLFPELIERKIPTSSLTAALQKVIAKRDEISDQCQSIRDILQELNTSEEAALAILNAKRKMQSAEYEK